MDDVNWTDVLWGGASSTQHDLSISGGTDKATYRLSVGYLYDQGTLQWGNNNNQRYNVRLSNSFKVTDRFTIESVMAASRQNQVSPTQIGSTLVHLFLSRVSLCLPLTVNRMHGEDNILRTGEPSWEEITGWLLLQ